MKPLIINLSYSDSHLKYCLEDVPDKSDILDFSGITVKLPPGGRKIFYARELDSDHLVEETGLNEFLSFASGCSYLRINNKYAVTDLQIEGAPVYWLTGFSEKSTELHWGYSFFFFCEFYKQKISFFKEYDSLHFIFPPYAYNVRKLVELMIKQDQALPDIFICKERKMATTRFTAFKFLVKVCSRIIRFYINYYFKVKPNKRENDVSSVAIVPFFSREEVKRRNATVYDVVQYAAEEQRKVKMISLPGLNIQQKDLFLINKIPGVRVVCRWLYSSVKILRLRADESNALEQLILADIQLQVWNTDMFFNYIRLKDFFSCITKPIKVIYEDEMYKWGRVISLAARQSKNKNITTIGIQHAAFSKYHNAVYRISQSEIDNGIPLPDKFVVWGSFFRNVILLNNNLNKDNIVVAGNLRYIKLTGLRKQSLNG
jgi:hypothetical protein